MYMYKHINCAEMHAHKHINVLPARELAFAVCEVDVTSSSTGAYAVTSKSKIYRYFLNRFISGSRSRRRKRKIPWFISSAFWILVFAKETLSSIMQRFPNFFSIVNTPRPLYYILCNLSVGREVFNSPLRGRGPQFGNHWYSALFRLSK
jgi:hypothetical protein